MKNAIMFDMDGVLAGLYNVPNWLDYLIANDPTPYAVAKPLVNMNRLARLLNRLQAEGYHIGIVSWLSKNSNEAYDRAVTEAKLRWLNHHLHSVHWDEIKIIPYGTPKHEAVEIVGGILFDDELPNRTNWIGKAYDETQIFEILKGLI